LCTVFGWGCATGTLFTSPDNSFGNGSTSSRESAAVDAQYGTNMTWDFYKTTFNRNGIFGNGTGSYNRVHYGSGYVNAFWDGTKMTYGDGDGVDYGPLTSLDVAGHEMSHGVTENTAGLTYSGESGGLNESTSDIFGTMVEFFANNGNDPGDYLIGEEFDLKNHLGFRRMDNPAADGSSANCWCSSTKNLDVHYSSGVGNHFFYLLSEGSGAKTLNGVSYNSPTCNGSTVTGIGRDAAAAIWYRALTVYMTSSTNYSGARTATLNAARDLYGAGSAQYNAVATAWSAVNVA
jgi:Zn-dependent metalloprotease